MQLSSRGEKRGTGRLARIICVAFLAAVLSGCSAVRVAYNNLPTVAYWWMDGYVDFNGAQTPRVRDDLDALLAWHREAELPQLIGLLQQAQVLAPQDLNTAQVCAFTDRVRDRLLAIADRAQVPAATLALSLDDGQLKQLERKYAKVNAEYAKEWLRLSPDEVHDKRYEQFLERNEDFFGRLDAQQRTLLRRLTAESRFDPRRVDAERRVRQREALVLLRRLHDGGASQAEAQTALRDYVQRIAEPVPGAWRDYQQVLLQEGCRNVAALHAATRPSQRADAVKRLKAYEADLRALAPR